jgi:hypothetical protein
MSLTPTIGNLCDLYHKLERERYRVFHAENPISKADHFYNFCITAHSFRDYFFSHFEIIDRQARDPYHIRWNESSAIRAARDIANSTKHFVLRNSPATQSVDSSNSMVVEIYENEVGKITPMPKFVEDYEVIFNDGEKLLTYEFMENVLSFWYSEITCSGIDIPKQSDDDLLAR